MLVAESFRSSPAGSGLQELVPLNHVLLAFMWPHPEYVVVVLEDVSYIAYGKKFLS